MFWKRKRKEKRKNSEPFIGDLTKSLRGDDDLDRMFKQHTCGHFSIVAVDETFDSCEDCGRRWFYIFSPHKARNRR